MQVVPHPLGCQGSADDVVVLSGDLPVRQQVGSRPSDRIAGRSDDRVSEGVRDVDLHLARRRVHHPRQAAGVRAGGREPRVVERGADLRDRDRAVRPLAELEELDSPVPDGREVLEHRGKAAGQRHERTEVSRVLGKGRPAQETGHRAVQPRDRVTDRELLDARLAGRDEALSHPVRAAERARRPRAEGGDTRRARGGRAEELPAADRLLLAHTFPPFVEPGAPRVRRPRFRPDCPMACSSRRRTSRAGRRRSPGRTRRRR